MAKGQGFVDRSELDSELRHYAKNEALSDLRNDFLTREVNLIKWIALINSGVYALTIGLVTAAVRFLGG